MFSVPRMLLSLGSVWFVFHALVYFAVHVSTLCSLLARREREIAQTIERSTAAITGLLACGWLRNNTHDTHKIKFL